MFIILAIVIVLSGGYCIARIAYNNREKLYDDEFREDISKFFAGRPERLSMLEKMVPMQKESIKMLGPLPTRIEHFVINNRMKRSLRILQEEINLEKQKQSSRNDLIHSG